MLRGDSRSKNDLKPPLLDERKRKKVLLHISLENIIENALKY